MNKTRAELYKALSQQDRSEVHKYAMKRSEEIKSGITEEDSPKAIQSISDSSLRTSEEWAAEFQPYPKETAEVSNRDSWTGKITEFRSGAKYLPSEEVLERAKKQYAEFDKDRGFVSICPCCRMTFDVPSVVHSLKEYGVCHGCKFFLDDLDGFTIKRPPTIDEVMSLDVKDLASEDIKVLYEFVKRNHGF